MKKHFDKRPNNALIAKSIEICEAEGKSHFIYGSYVYHDPNSSLTEFKRRNGFESITLPRYFIPITLKGKVAMALGLHRGIAANTPKSVMRQFLKIRSFWSNRRAKSTGTKISGEGAASALEQGLFSGAKPPGKRSDNEGTGNRRPV
jgi:hypothetical protein